MPSIVPGGMLIYIYLSREKVFVSVYLSVLLSYISHIVRLNSLKVFA